MLKICLVDKHVNNKINYYQIILRRFNNKVSIQLLQMNFHYFHHLSNISLLFHHLCIIIFNTSNKFHDESLQSCNEIKSRKLPAWNKIPTIFHTSRKIFVSSQLLYLPVSRNQSLLYTNGKTSIKVVPHILWKIKYRYKQLLLKGIFSVFEP